MPVAGRITAGDEGIRVLIPVLSRPGHVAKLLESLRASEQTVPLRELFLLTEGDEPELEAVLALDADYAVLPGQHARGDYARKVNFGLRLTGEPWLLNGADDLRFRLGWAEAALAAAAATGARVVGCNDLGRWAGSERASPHTLVARSYALERGTADGVLAAIMHEGYGHNYVDTELVATAKARGEYVYAHDVVIEHLHPVWRKGAIDAVYRIGRAESVTDAKLFRRREQLWTT